MAPRSKLLKRANTSQMISSVAIFLNETKPEAVRMLRVVISQLKSRGVKAWVAHNANHFYDRSKASREDASLIEKLRRTDIAVALGGDGTMLRVARLLAPYSIPLLGVNSGGLGFLSGADASEFAHACDQVLRGKFSMEERWMISVEAYRGAKRIFGPHLALNDCVIRCADQARAILLRTRSAHNFVADYFGDGLIVSTPTGSTAYALAASGPIVEPSLEVLIIAPICPHTLTQRPLIVPAAQPFAVRLEKRRAIEDPQVLMSLDGQVGGTLQVGDEVRIRRYEKPCRLLVNPKRSYFEILRRKFKWGER